MTALDRSVLIVEDDDLAADAVCDGLRLAGYAVCGIARSVDDAVALVRAHRPRLAVVDIDLGAGGSGIEAARQVLRLSPIGIVYVTGRPDMVDRADVGHAWMLKPHRLLNLINALGVVRAVSEQAPITGPMPPDLTLLPQRPGGGRRRGEAAAGGTGIT
jgi:DNA-binding response OmpR family regulator